MAKQGPITPQELFERFADDRAEHGHEAMRRFGALDAEAKAAFLEPALEFLTRRGLKDEARSWATTTLMRIGGDTARTALLNYLTAPADDDAKADAKRTRFFALTAARRMAMGTDDAPRVLAAAQAMAGDEAEGALARAGARLVLAEQGDDASLQAIRAVLRRVPADPEGARTEAQVALRALRNVPIKPLVDEIVEVLHCTPYMEQKIYAIKALACPEYSGMAVARGALGILIQSDPSPHLRLEAVLALTRHGDEGAAHFFFGALDYRDAEVRVQAANGMVSALGVEGAAMHVIAAAVQTDDDDEHSAFVQALRVIDPTRKVSTALLTDALGDSNRKRAQRAEAVLARLGGWEAVRKLGDRRQMLESLEGYLADSEKVVRELFDETIKHAKDNFRFAMWVNISLVLFGIALLITAMFQVTTNPAEMKQWLAPGGTGLLAIVVTQFFNDPRKNATRDLTTLLNANVIFLGFLRQVNEIDATFKHGYLENDEFGPEQMAGTVDALDEAVRATLQMATTYLGSGTGVPVPAPPDDDAA